MRNIILIALLLLAGSASRAVAQGTAFTYQGRLKDGSGPASGTYDLRFKLFLDPLGNNQAGGTVLSNGVAIADGLFAVTLDFGAGVFNGSNYWLEVDVKTNGAGVYASLNPLQPVTPVPYALFAENATSGGLAAGTYTNPVTLNNASNIFGGSFNGNGSGLTNVDALTLGGLGAAGFWQLGGNALGGGQFIGSTNNEPLELRVNGTRALRLEPNTNGAPNVIGGAPVNYVDPGIVGATIAGGGNVSGSFYLGGGSNHISAIFGTIAGGRVNTVAADHGFIGGGISNTVQAAAYDSVIGGGVANIIETNAAESALVGGTFNSIQPSASYAFLGGGSGNSIQASAYFSFLGAGSGNSIQPGARYSVLGGGNGNAIYPNLYYAVLGGGSANSIQAGAYNTFLGGGGANSIQTNASYAFLGGGSGNSIQTNAGYSVLGGGSANSIQTNATYSFLGGGRNNSIRSNANHAVISGGFNNAIGTNATYATIGGGFGNLSGGSSAVVAGGSYNSNLGDLSSVGGGFLNQNGAQFGTVGGGASNTNGGYAGTIAGGQSNTNNGYAATIGGGQGNAVLNQTTTIGGGWGNLSSGFVSTVGGGYLNRGLGDYATVGGGNNNVATAGYGFVGGGGGNTAGGFYATVSGGYGNSANGYSATANGGADNSASGNYATVSGGYSNIAAGDFSFAAGAGANAAGNRSFVWNSFPNPNYAVGTNEFFVFAENGFSIDYNNQTLFGGGDRWVYIGKGKVGFPGTPATISTWNGAYLSDGGLWTSSSDRARKENFAAIDPRSVLEKVAALSIQTWNYTNEPPTMRHLGPVAQDFHAAFGLNGRDDKHIADIDEGGVALAAIQGLNQKEEANRAALKAREAEIQELKLQNLALSKRLTELERLITRGHGQAP